MAKKKKSRGTGEAGKTEERIPPQLKLGEKAYTIDISTQKCSVASNIIPGSSLCRKYEGSRCSGLYACPGIVAKSEQLALGPQEVAIMA